jgi:hypothetical protein
VTRAGSRYVPGQPLYHGTSPNAVPKILRAGLRPGRKGRDPVTLRAALAAMAPSGRWWGPYHRRIAAAKRAGDTAAESAAYDEWDDWYMGTFTERAAAPMGGYIYVTTELEEILTRSASGETEYVFEIEPTGRLIPDEDWMGAAMIWASRVARPRPGTGPQRLWRNRILSDARAAYDRLSEIEARLPEQLKRDLRGAEEHGAEERFEWQALAGKAVIRHLERTTWGRAALEALVPYASTLAHEGSPRLTRLYRMESRQHLGPRDEYGMAPVTFRRELVLDRTLAGSPSREGWYEDPAPVIERHGSNRILRAPIPVPLPSRTLWVPRQLIALEALPIDTIRLWRKDDAAGQPDRLAVVTRSDSFLEVLRFRWSRNGWSQRQRFKAEHPADAAVFGPAGMDTGDRSVLVWLDAHRPWGEP